MAGLLQAADLPAGMSPTGDIQEGSDFDVDASAFDAQGGIRVVSRTWSMDTDAGTSIVFDLRFQFATPEAAAAYLTAALPTLGETTTTGLHALPEPTPPIGTDMHGFGLDVQGDTGPAVIRDYVFRVGPVVAKVVAGGAGITADQAEAIARVAADRMASAGTPAPGSPRPIATNPPASASPGPSVPAGDLTPLLLAHIPAAIASTCTPDAQRLWAGELVTLVCSPTDADVTVTYSGFDSQAHMETAYQSSLDTIDLSDMSSGCDVGTWSGGYKADGADIGQMTCWAEANGRALMWSDERMSILGVAVSPTLDAAGLYLWWQSAGPDP